MERFSGDVAWRLPKSLVLAEPGFFVPVCTHVCTFYAKRAGMFAVVVYLYLYLVLTSTHLVGRLTYEGIPACTVAPTRTIGRCPLAGSSPKTEHLSSRSINAYQRLGVVASQSQLLTNRPRAQHLCSFLRRPRSCQTKPPRRLDRPTSDAGCQVMHSFAPRPVILTPSQAKWHT